MFEFLVYLSIEYLKRDGSSERLAAIKKFTQSFIPQVGWVIEVVGDGNGVTATVSSVRWNPVDHSMTVRTETPVYCDSVLQVDKEFLESIGWECSSR
jgi:hypothetical protein